MENGETTTTSGKKAKHFKKQSAHLYKRCYICKSDMFHTCIAHKQINHGCLLVLFCAHNSCCTHRAQCVQKALDRNFLGKCGKPKDAARMRWKRADKGQRLSVKMNNSIKSGICGLLWLCLGAMGPFGRRAIHFCLIECFECVTLNHNKHRQNSSGHLDKGYVSCANQNMKKVQ